MITSLLISVPACIPAGLSWSLGCADTPTEPDTLTEAEIEVLVDARVAEELAKIDQVC